MLPVASDTQLGGGMVSCLMLTLSVPERLDFVRRSIAAYCRQTLLRKELVVVVDGGVTSGRDALLDYIGSLNRSDIRIVAPAGPLSLGQLRNISVAAARGDFLRQWDDDDCSHPERLARQLTHMLEGNHEAVLLQDVVQYFPQTRSLYCVNWRATEAGGHPGTLMVRRSVPIDYPTAGSEAQLGEDLRIALALKQRGRFGYLARMPYLFVYVSHGHNSWHEGHHRMLASTLSISQGLLRRREAEIRAGLKFFDFGPGAVGVQGSNGLAFRL
jgi:glycosyltransferase involved in cell wall biosynthesis